MSYDFHMMKPKAPIQSEADLGEDTLLKQDGAAVVNELSALFPSSTWQRESDGSWFGSLPADDSWYKFRIGAEPEYSWTIAASHRATTRSLIPMVCNALDVIAFDGQAIAIIQPDGRGPA